MTVCASTKSSEFSPNFPVGRLSPVCLTSWVRLPSYYYTHIDRPSRAFHKIFFYALLEKGGFAQAF
jgi:hypothetical protein